MQTFTLEWQGRTFEVMVDVEVVDHPGGPHEPPSSQVTRQEIYEVAEMLPDDWLYHDVNNLPAALDEAIIDRSTDLLNEVA